MPVRNFHVELLKRARNFLAASANRISFVWAIRGTISTAIPLLFLPLIGFGAESHLVVIGALNTSMVDFGGTYRARLNAMALNAALSPLSLALGSLGHEFWWLAAELMFLVALGSGLARAIGPNGTPLGLFVGLAFLIGTSLPVTAREVIAATALYFAGGLWTILIALIFWRLRPFKRLEQEVAGVWESTVGLIAAMRAVQAMPVSVVQRRRQERHLAEQHQNLRGAVERARATLGTLRGEITGPGTMFAQLFILVRAASRIATAAVTLGEIRRHEARHHIWMISYAAIDASAKELEHACRAVAASLLAGRRKLSLESIGRQVKELASGLDATAPEVMAFAQALRHLENAEEAMILLFGADPGLSLLPPLSHVGPRGRAIAAIRAQLSLRSAVFRHALRVAVASAAATAIMLWLDLPHGIWLPMTTLVVVQPEFGGTFARALERTAGTMAGAATAGLLLSTLHGPMALELAVTGLLFAAFFVQRRRRGLGVTLLTPLIVLLLATSVGSPWLDTLYRVLYTIAGAALGLIAGYLLWPEWERQRVPDQLANAIRANRRYMLQVLQALTGAATPPEALGETRRQAEIATGNAEAGFQRLLTEPRKHRGGIALAFALITYVQRLERHLIALAAHIGIVTLPSADLTELAARLGSTQEAIAAAILESRAPELCPSFDEWLGRLRAKLSGGEPTGPGSTVAFLLGRLVSDTTSLHFAATTK
jgi:uncharacterized membrane protein YccC